MAGGTAVTISGKNFRKNSDGTAPTVLFGSNPATSVVVVNSTTITCNTPAALVSDTVDVSVTCGTQTGTLTDCFLYAELVITSISPAFGTFGGGTAVLITGVNFTSAGLTVTFGGSGASTIVFIDSEHISCVTPNHAAGYVDIVVGGTFGPGTLRNGFQYTTLTRGADIRRSPGISIQQTLNSQPYRASFQVDGNSNVPVIGERLEIIDSFDGNRLLFAGTAIRVTQSFTSTSDYTRAVDQLQYGVDAADFAWLLNRRRPVGNYTYVSVSEVVKDLGARYAPGFDFTSYVQTKLAPVTISFDGTNEFTECLSILAQAIGGGHWYVDYQQKIHFFHIAPRSAPIGITQTLAAKPTVTVGVAIGGAATYLPGFYCFAWTSVDAGSRESSPSLFSNPLLLTGLSKLDFTVPVGSGATRNVYAFRLATPFSLGAGITNIPANDGVSLVRIATITNNTTTTFTAYFQGDVTTILGITDANVTAPVANTVIPIPQKSRASAPQPASSLALDQDQGQNYWNGGAYICRVGYLYRNGTMSFVGSASNTAVQFLQQFIGVRNKIVSNIPIGPDLNGVECIARFVVLGSVPTTIIPNTNQFEISGTPTWPSKVSPFWVADNTTTLAYFRGIYVGSLPNDLFTPTQTGTSGVLSASQWGANVPVLYSNKNSLDANEPIPVWPNPDGPDLEASLPQPVDVTDADTTYLLRDTAPSVSVDASQIRNRITVIGSGCVITEDANVGTTQIKISDVTAFSVNGGTVLADGRVSLDYSAPNNDSTEDDTGILLLTTPLTTALKNGVPIVNYYRADDVDSQIELAKVELDHNGAKTDGIHEYTIVDSSLKAFFQLYMRAHAELELFSKPIISVTYSTRDPNSRPGAIVSIDLSFPPVKGDFLIQDVTIDQIHDEVDAALLPRYDVTATSVKFSLEDLLLSLLANQTVNQTSTPSNGLTGLTQTVTNGGDSTEDAIPNLSLKVSGWLGFMGSTSSPFFTNVNYGAWTTGVTVAGVTQTYTQDIRAIWARMTTNSASTGLLSSAAFILPLRPNPRVITRVRTLGQIDQMYAIFGAIVDRAPSMTTGGKPNTIGTYIGFVGGAGGVRPFYFLNPSGAANDELYVLGPVLAEWQTNIEYLCEIQLNWSETAPTATMIVNKTAAVMNLSGVTPTSFTTLVSRVAQDGIVYGVNLVSILRLGSSNRGMETAGVYTEMNNFI